MREFGIYEIQQDDNGIFVLIEQLSSKRETFVNIQELVEYIENDLEDVQREVYEQEDDD